MKKIYLILSLLPSLSFAQQEFPELKVKAYSPRIYLQRDTNIGGFIQGIQTQLQNGTDNWFFGSLGTQNWIVSKGDYTGVKFSINENGNVGIGTQNPREKLDINGDLIIDNGSNHTHLRLGNRYNNNIISDSSPSKHYGGGYFFRVHNDNIAHKYIDAMMIADNGYIGIGSHKPKEKLDINGNLIIDNGSNHTHLRLGNRANNNIISDSSPNKHYGGGYFFRVHNDNIPHKYIDAIMLAENGNVGIGSHNPTEKLDVQGNAKIRSWSPRIYLQRDTDQGGFIQGIQTQLLDGKDNWFFGNLYHDQWIVSKGDYTDVKFSINENGNVGIGTQTPKSKLDIEGFVTLAGNASNLDPHHDPDKLKNAISNSGKVAIGWNLSGGKGETDFISNRGLGSTGGFSFYDIDNSGTINHILNLHNNGNAALYGKFEAKEVKVTETPTADFVFEEDYKLPTLQEVEKHIKEKKHLPEIASAKEMEKEGVNVGEFQIQLLQKIEELTLYMIEQNKEIQKLNNEIQQLKNN